MVINITVILKCNTVFSQHSKGVSANLLYNIEGSVCGQSVEERQKAIVQLESIFRTTGFPYHIVPLEQVTSPRIETF